MVGYAFANPPYELPVGQITRPSGKSANQSPALPRKIFRFRRRANHLYKLARLVPRGAARDRHGRGTGRGGRGSIKRAIVVVGRSFGLVSDSQHADERRCCGRRSRVVLTPRRWRQVGGVLSARPGSDKSLNPQATVSTSRSPGRARRKPLKPLRGECRVIPV